MTTSNPQRTLRTHQGGRQNQVKIPEQYAPPALAPLPDYGGMDRDHGYLPNPTENNEGHIWHLQNQQRFGGATNKKPSDNVSNSGAKMTNTKVAFKSAPRPPPSTIPKTEAKPYCYKCGDPTHQAPTCPRYGPASRVMPVDEACPKCKLWHSGECRHPKFFKQSSQMYPILAQIHHNADEDEHDPIEENLDEAATYETGSGKDGPDQIRADTCYDTDDEMVRYDYVNSDTD